MKSASVLSRAVVYGGIVTVGVAVVGSIVGFLVAGVPGLVSALIGAGLTALFMGFTSLSILIAERVTKVRPSSTRYFAVVLGMWVFKFAVFIAILIALRGQAWVNPYVFFAAVLAAVIGSLITDALALSGARVPYVGDIELPVSIPPAGDANSNEGS